MNALNTLARRQFERASLMFGMMLDSLRCKALASLEILRMHQESHDDIVTEQVVTDLLIIDKLFVQIETISVAKHSGLRHMLIDPVLGAPLSTSRSPTGT